MVKLTLLAWSDDETLSDNIRCQPPDATYKGLIKKVDNHPHVEDLIKDDTIYAKTKSLLKYKEQIPPGLDFLRRQGDRPINLYFQQMHKDPAQHMKIMPLQTSVVCQSTDMRKHVIPSIRWRNQRTDVLETQCFCFMCGCQLNPKKELNTEKAYADAGKKQQNIKNGVKLECDHVLDAMCGLIGLNPDDSGKVVQLYVYLHSECNNRKGAMDIFDVLRQAGTYGRPSGQSDLFKDPDVKTLVCRSFIKNLIEEHIDPLVLNNDEIQNRLDMLTLLKEKSNKFDNLIHEALTNAAKGSEVTQGMVFSQEEYEKLLKMSKKYKDLKARNKENEKELEDKQQELQEKQQELGVLQQKNNNIQQEKKEVQQELDGVTSTIKEIPLQTLAAVAGVARSSTPAESSGSSAGPQPLQPSYSVSKAAVDLTDMMRQSNNALKRQRDSPLSRESLDRGESLDRYNANTKQQRTDDKRNIGGSKKTKKLIKNHRKISRKIKIRRGT